MKNLILCLVAGALPGLGGARWADTAPIALYTQFETIAPAPLVSAIQEELVSILTPAGVRFSWRPLADAGTQVSSQLAVIKFKGNCSSDSLRPENGYPGPLGWTHISDGEIIPFIDVNCEGIRLFVQRDLLGVKASERDTVLGRALARVVAHELYHLLANTQHHARQGIAKAAYTTSDLLSPSMVFGEKECDLMHALTARRAGLPVDNGQ